MPDLKPRVNPLFLREEDLRQGMELLFYAWRDFAAEADAVLERQGLGQAHHRAIVLIGRYPGIGMSELLRLLRITKQSLSRVLNELVEAGFVEARVGPRDRRRRALTLTAKGQALEETLSEAQRRRFARAYRQAGAEAVEGFRKVLMGLCDEDHRRRIEQAERG